MGVEEAETRPTATPVAYQVSARPSGQGPFGREALSARTCWLAGLHSWYLISLHMGVGSRVANDRIVADVFVLVLGLIAVRLHGAVARVRLTIGFAL
jgi:hypothetical protein